MKTRFLGALLAIFLSGCGSDVGITGKSIGGACASNGDCDPQSRCLIGGEFPQGMCVVNCARADDCGDEAACIKKEGGVCLPRCTLPADCRGGYECKGKENQAGGGEALVCIK